MGQFVQFTLARQFMSILNNLLFALDSFVIQDFLSILDHILQPAIGH